MNLHRLIHKSLSLYLSLSHTHTQNPAVIHLK